MSSLLHSVKLILFTLLLVHLILQTCTYHRITTSLSSLSPSVTPSAFHSKLKTHLFHKFLRSLSGSICYGIWTISQIFDSDWISVIGVYYRAMHFSAKRGIAIACRLSVRPSVTLVNCDHIGWKSSKIISPSVSLACSLFATQTSRVYSKGNTLKFSPE